MLTTFDFDKDIFFKNGVAYWKKNGQALTQEQIDYVLDWAPGSEISFPDMDLDNEQQLKEIKDKTSNILDGVANADNPNDYLDSLINVDPEAFNQTLASITGESPMGVTEDITSRGDTLSRAGDAYKKQFSAVKDDSQDYATRFIKGLEKQTNPGGVIYDVGGEAVDYLGNVGAGTLELLDYGEDALNFLVRQLGEGLGTNYMQSDLIPRDVIDSHYKKTPDDKPLLDDLYNLGVDFLDLDKTLYETFFGEGTYMDPGIGFKKR